MKALFHEKPVYYWSLILVVVLMIVIFCFSAQPAEKSNESSTKIAEVVVETIEAIVKKEPLKNKDNLEHIINVIVRKLAHMTEYAILAMVMGVHLYHANCRDKKFLFWNLVFCIFYASTDEFHQLFVPGRDGAIRDVCIDTIGILIGTFIIYKIVRKLWVKSRPVSVIHTP